MKIKDQSVSSAISVQQKRIWNLLGATESAYNIVVLLRVTEVDQVFIRNRIVSFLNQHEIFRTSFILPVARKYPNQKIHSNVFLSFQDKKINDYTRLNEIVKEEKIHQFDLASGPAIRITFVHRQEDFIAVCISMSAIYADKTTMINMAKFMAEEADINPIEENELLNYGDYSAWQITSVQEQSDEQSAKENITEALSFERMASYETNDRMQSSLLSIHEEELKKLKEFSSSCKLSLESILFSCWGILLSRYQNQSLQIAFSYSGRNIEGLEESAGPFENSVPVKVQVNGEDTFYTYLIKVSEQLKNRSKRQHDHLFSTYDESGDILTNAYVFSYLEIKGLNQERIQIQAIEDYRDIYKLKLDSYYNKDRDGLNLILHYDRRFYNKDIIQTLLSSFHNVLHSVMEDSDLKITKGIALPGNELDHIKNKLTLENRDLFFLTSSVVESFSKIASTCPDQIGIETSLLKISYSELDEKSWKLANHLKKKGIGKGDIVTVRLKRSEWVIISMLGIMKTGAAFLPVDDKLPAERLSYIYGDSGAQLLITDQWNQHPFPLGVVDISHELLNDERSDPFHIELHAEDKAYVIYTSGTTGRPKGVIITQMGLAHYCQWFSSSYNITVFDKTILFSSYAFDLCYTAIWPSLTSGATLYLVDHFEFFDPELVIKEIISKEVTYIKLTPSHFSLIGEALGKSPNRLRLIVLGGEHIRLDDLHHYWKKNSEMIFVNHYGPTETTIGTIAHTMVSSDYETLRLDRMIGRPIGSNSVYILDENRSIVPIGVQGEIAIAGPGLALGYLNDPELSSAKFIASSHDSQKKIYLTGDIGKWHPDGRIELFGRKDNQIKLRGYRIEIQEIEKILQQHPGIANAVVVLRNNAIQIQEGDVALYGYWVSGKTEPMSDEIVRDYLHNHLPEYMIPAQLMEIDQVPLTQNGKVNISALPTMHQISESEIFTPSTVVESVLLDQWKDILGNIKIGITDDFFRLGGDSIKAIQIASRLRNLGYKLEVRTIFQFRTIKDIAQRTIKVRREIPQSAVTGQLPLTPIQKEFFLEESTLFQSKIHSVFLKIDRDVTSQGLQRIFNQLIAHHDALRIIFKPEGTQILQINNGLGQQAEFQSFDLTRHSAHDAKSFIKEKAKEINGYLTLNDTLFRTAAFFTTDNCHLYLVAHHLIIDTISWRILLDDFFVMLQQEKEGKPLVLPLKTDSYKSWSYALSEFATSTECLEKENFWRTQEYREIQQSIPVDFEDDFFEAGSISITLDVETTQSLLAGDFSNPEIRVNDLLLTALGIAFEQTFENDQITIALEGHGRDEVIPDVDVTRTVGWFTSVFPVLLDLYRDKSWHDRLSHTHQHLNEVFRNGIYYGILKYLSGDKPNSTLDIKPPIKFNYLGQFNNQFRDAFNNDYYANSSSTLQAVHTHKFLFDITGFVIDNQLNLILGYNKRNYKRSTVERLWNNYEHALKFLGVRNDGLGENSISREVREQLRNRLGDQIKDYFQLTPTQQGILFHTLQNHSSYFNQISYSVRGALSLEALKYSLSQLCARHDILRTAIVYTDLDPALQVILENRQIELFYNDICDIEDVNKYIEKYKADNRLRNFDLEKDTLLRVAVLKTALDQHYFIWSHHHILMDGWCNGILIAEFDKYYEAFLQSTEVKMPPAVSYRTYIDWLSEIEPAASLAFWKTYLEGIEESTVIPESSLKKGEKQHYAHQKKVFSFDIQMTKSLVDLSRSQRVSLSTFIQALWAVLLWRYNKNQDDVVFGLVVSGRPEALEGVEKIIGLFINTIPVRVQVNPELSFAELLQTIQSDSALRESHQYCSLAEVQSQSFLKNNLINHLMVFENYPVFKHIENRDVDPGANALDISEFDSLEQTNYDFNIIVIPESVLTIRFEYNGYKYDEAFVNSMVKHFQTLSQAVLHDPDCSVGDLNYLTDEQINQVLIEFNENPISIDKHKSIIDLFELQVDRTPEKMAVSFGNDSITYQQLDERSNQVARHLMECCEVKMSDFIGITYSRSIEAVVGILGIIKSGAAYVPIDSHLPINRIELMIRDCACKTILTDGTMKLDLPGRTVLLDDSDQMDRSRLNVSRNLNGPMYSIYTSGSTGIPKSVVQTQICISNLVQWQINSGLFERGQRVLQWSSLSFDVAIHEMAYTFLSGGILVIVPEETKNDVQQLAEFIQSQKIEVFWQAATVLNLLMEISDDIFFHGHNIKHIISTAEQLKIGNGLRRFLEKSNHVQLHNFYGPSETHVVTAHVERQITEATRIYQPIGKPLPNSQIFILDEYLKPVPVGCVGNIYMAGVCLASGYLNNPEITIQKFLPHLLDSKMQMYNSGDLGRWLPTGEIEYIGRIDNQVKVRGFRIELGEIEQCLLKLKEISEAIASVRQDKEGQNYLVAYLVVNTERPIDEIKRHLTERLPSYMVPEAIIKVKSFPLTDTGKVNKKLLPDPPGRFAETGYKAPRTQIESSLVAVWEDVLERKSIGVDDHFFEIGGHSLKATRVLARIRKQFNVDIKLNQLFSYPTISELALLIIDSEDATESDIKVIEEQQHYEMSTGQRRFFLMDQLGYSKGLTIARVYLIRGALNRNFLEMSFYHILNRHEILRTNFIHVENAYRQVILNTVESVTSFVYMDKSSDKYEGDWQALVNEELTDEINEPLTIGKERLTKIVLRRISKDEYIIMLKFHHILIDEWSLEILFKEWINEYEMLLKTGQYTQRSNDRIQYKDYSAWHNQHIKSEYLNSSEKFWLENFSTQPKRLNLSASKRPDRKTFNGKSKTFRIEREMVGDIGKFVKNSRTSWYITILSCINVLLNKLTSDFDFVIGSPVTSRGTLNVENQIGPYLNIIPLRNSFTKDHTFNSLNELVQLNFNKAIVHQDYPFELIAEKLGFRRDHSRSLLFDVGFTWHEQALDTLPQFTELEIIDIKPHRSVSQTDIWFHGVKSENEISIVIEYNSDLFDDLYLNKMAKALKDTINKVITTPDLPLSEFVKDEVRSTFHYQESDLDLG